MLRRFLSLFSKLSRKARRSRKFEAARPSPKLRLFLESLDQRLVPSSAAVLSQSGNTLTITEYTAFNDSITETSAFGGKYSVVTSANGGNAQNFSNVSNIVFNAATSGINVLFNSSGGTYNTTGNVSINSTTNFVGTFIEFDGTQNVQGAVTVSQTGIGDSTDFVALNAHLGSLTVTGGSAINSSNSSNTFVNVSDPLHNGSIQGTLVDLEGTTIAGSATINFGAGGGYFLTDYTLDLGNSGADAPNTSPGTVQIGGNLSITDLRTRTEDTFGMFNANVGGNLSINVSSLGANESIGFQNYSISKNLTITTNTTGAHDADVYIENSSVQGNASFTQSGGNESSVHLNYFTVNGSLSVTQSTTVGYVYAYGADGTVGGSLGSVTIKQSGEAGTVYLENFSTIKGPVSVTQTGAGANSVYISNNSTMSGNLSLTQSGLYNEVDIYNVSINGATLINQAATTGNASVYVENSLLSSGLSIVQTTTNTSGGGFAETYLGNDSIKGNVSATQGAGLANEILLINTSLTAGSLTVNQSAAVTGIDEFAVTNGSSINGSLTVNQAGSEGFVYLANGSSSPSNVSGSVTITQKSLLGYVELGGGASSSIGGAVTVTQTGVVAETEIINESIKGAMKLTENANGYSDAFVINSAINGSLSIIQSQAALYNVMVIEGDSINGSVNLSQATGIYYIEPTTLILANDEINGSLTISHAINGGGEFAFINISDIQVTGNVSISQNGGLTNEVLIVDSNISGSLTINQSATVTAGNEVQLLGDQINGSAAITQTSGGEDLVELEASTLSGALTVKQGGSVYNQTYINDSSVTGTVTIGQGTGGNKVAISNGSTLAGNVSITGNSSFGGEVIVNDSNLSKNLSVVEGKGQDYFYVENGAQVIGNVTANLGGTSNLADLYDSTIFGTLTLNLGIGVTADNTVELESDPAGTAAGLSIHGATTVGMGDGVNTVDVGQDGGVTFVANASFAANISGYNTYNSSNTSGAGTVTFKNF
jgi:hypothetical protein